jgi:hypothetical protein
VSSRKRFKPSAKGSRPASPSKDRGWLIAPGLVFATAIAWRLYYLARLSNSLLAGAMFDDARIYWEWSGRIAAGDLIGTNPFFLAPLYPYVIGTFRALGATNPSTMLIIQRPQPFCLQTLRED